jgi:hypothetical protein
MGNEMNGEDGGYAVVVVEMMPNPSRIFVVLKICCPRACYPIQIPSRGFYEFWCIWISYF